MIDAHDGAGFVDRTGYVRVGSPSGPGISVNKGTNGSTAVFQTTDLSGARYDVSTFDDPTSVFGPAYVPKLNDSVKIYNKTGLLLFVGFVDDVSISNLDSDTHIFADVKCVDMGVMCSRRRFFGSFDQVIFPTYNSLVNYIISPGLFGLGVSFAPSPLLAVPIGATPVQFLWVTVAEALNQIGSALNCDWFIDENSNLMFFDDTTGHSPAPVNFDDTVPSTWKTLSIQDTGSRFANRVTVKTSSPISSTVTFTLAGDPVGIYVIVIPPESLPVVKVNGAAVLVVRQADTAAFPLYHFYYRPPPDAALNLIYNPGLPPLSSADTVEITMQSKFAGVAFAPAITKLIDSNAFDVIVDAQNVKSQDELQAIANALLMRLSSGPKNFTAVTYTDGFTRGQLVHIDVSQYGVSADFIVQSVSSREIGDASDSGFFVHTVTGSTKPNQGHDTASYIQKLLARGRTVTNIQTQHLTFSLVPTIAGVANSGLATIVKPTVVRAGQNGVMAFVSLAFANLVSGAATTSADITIDIFQNGVSIFPSGKLVLLAGSSSVKSVAFASNPLNIVEGDIFTYSVTGADAAAKDGILDLVYFGQ